MSVAQLPKSGTREPTIQRTASSSIAGSPTAGTVAKPRTPIPVPHTEVALASDPLDGVDIDKLAKRLFEPLHRMMREAVRTEPIETNRLKIDEVARRMYEPLTRLLRAELRDDRARAGRAHERRY